ncbi:hypothetical protein SeMB42_g04261 [Synchytrium endobioticum]|uniref:START domain-containing protein n=1 Tax=Synchytrium endobioticum TaxID=286115 RepID=A0A507CZJ4_9FUNG|nr:hypothetical protein SeLEV6574_g05173 [Synchytrium endobioticum]TPX44637.1 hypothetical protein SeMB42_g04261 [Synchytrium endobioticum]
MCVPPPALDNDPAFQHACYMDPQTKEHITKARALLATVAAADGWKMHSSSKGVKVETLAVEGDPLPATRGSGIVDAGVEEFIRCVRSAGARKIWDPRFEDGHLVRHLGGNNNTLFSRIPGIMKVVAPRFIYGVQQRYYLPSTDTHVVLITSLPASEKDAPLPKGYVAVNVKFAAWYLTPLETGASPQTQIVYYSWVDPCGTIPPALVKLVSTQAGMCVATVRDYLVEFGAPLGVSAVGWILIDRFEFEHKTRAYDFIASLSDHVTDEQVRETYMEINIDPKMYPSGVVFSQKGADLTDVDCVMVKNGRSETNRWVKVRFSNAKWRGTIMVVCTKRKSGDFKMTINDKVMDEVDSF